MVLRLFMPTAIPNPGYPVNGKQNKLSRLVVNINYSPPVAPIPTVNLYYSAFSLIAGLTVKYLN
jgi:hypothetical protein